MGQCILSGRHNITPLRDRKGSDANKGVGMVGREGGTASCKFLRGSATCPSLQTSPSERGCVHRSVLLLHQMWIRPSHDKRVPLGVEGSVGKLQQLFSGDQRGEHSELGEDGSSSIVLPTTKLLGRSQTPCEESLRSNCPLGLTRQPALKGVCDNEEEGW